MTYLVKFDENYADEFDVGGMALYSNDKLERELALMIKLLDVHDNPEGSFHFGSNEGIEGLIPDTFIHMFQRAVLLTETEELVLRKTVFGKGDECGHMPCVPEIFDAVIYELLEEGKLLEEDLEQ